MNKRQRKKLNKRLAPRRLARSVADHIRWRLSRPSFASQVFPAKPIRGVQAEAVIIDEMGSWPSDADFSADEG